MLGAKRRCRVELPESFEAEKKRKDEENAALKAEAAKAEEPVIGDTTDGASGSGGTESTIIIPEDVTGSIYELEKDEVSSPPKGSKRFVQGKLPISPEFPFNSDWIKPEDLLVEMWEKKRALGDESDNFKLEIESSDLLKEDTWEIPELSVLKCQLNEVKSRLDTLPLDHWHNHTKKMNISALVMQYIKKYFNPEFSSQAWAKLFEILATYQVIPGELIDEHEELMNDVARLDAGEKIPFDSVHLCEAPGAFVSALNHFLKISWEHFDWNWIATTLSPYHEGNDVGKMINDDRLILMSLDHWTFLEDGTGNILSMSNVNKLISEKQKLTIERLKKRQSPNRVLLVTADGSIDCQTNPAEQESIVASLQFGEIVAALRILHSGGSFILKIFTFLEASTICHLYLLSCAFKEVHLFKPATSKEGNSEVYVICLGYLKDPKISSLVEKHLFPRIETYGEELAGGKVLFPLAKIPTSFIERIKESAKFFCDYQMRIMSRNISCFPTDTRMYQMMKSYRKEAAEQWIELVEITKLPANDCLFTSKDDALYNYSDLSPSCHLDVREEMGCFLDKVNRQSGSDAVKLEYIDTGIPKLAAIWKKGARIQQIEGCPVKHESIPAECQKPYDNIRCSRFCYGRMLSDRQELREIAGKYLTELQENQKLDTVEEGVFCNGHVDDSVIIASIMGKVVDESVEKKQLKKICCKKRTWDVFTKTDFEIQLEHMNNTLAAVNSLETGKSLFLCRFPLLTRLQAGFILALASMFDKAIMCVDIEKNVVGIMLFQFKGVTQPEEKCTLSALEGVLKIVGTDDTTLLEILPMKTLLELMPVEYVLRYNILLLVQDMSRLVKIAECGMKSAMEKEMNKNNGIPPC